MKRCIALLAAVAIISLAACGKTSSDGQKSPIESNSDISIGAYLPLTGVASFVGQGWQLGSQLAVQEINSNGGVNGHNLKFTYEDDGGTPAGAVTASRRLVQQGEVFAVMGGSTSTATVAVVPSMADGPTPLYVSLGSDPAILDPFSPFVFSGAGVPSKDVVAAMAEFLTKTLKAKKVAILECDQAFCQSSVPTLKASLLAAGVQVPTVQTYASGATDFTGQIAAIKDAIPDVVVNFGLAADGGRIIPQIRRAGIDAAIVGDTSQADPSVLEVAGAASEGFYSFWIGGSQFLDDQSGAMGNWRARFEKAFPDAPNGTPNLYSLMAYADTYVVAEGLRRCESDLTQQNFLKQLETIGEFVAGDDKYFHYAAPIGLPRSFSADDHQGTTIVTPIVSKDGKFMTAE